MTDYNQTLDTAGVITTRFEKMLRNLTEDYEDDMVIMSLMRYYNLCLDNGDDTILWAIERVLEDYMVPHDFDDWMLTKGK